jgi:transcriptional regulator NrdR family protein
MSKVHDVMAEYLKLEIKNHPSVSLEYVKFLAFHASFKDVQVFKKRLETMEKEAKPSSSKG